jgi:hypothetical protein
MVQAQGMRLMAPLVCMHFHLFVAKLKQWEMGVPMDHCSRASWAWVTIEAAVEKGAHKAVTSTELIALILL